jgi:penicillin-binding protein 2
MLFFFRRRKPQKELSFDEILLDSSNLPSFNRGRMEGRIEKPISRGSILAVALIFMLIVVVFTGKLFMLQVSEGAEFARQSTENTLRDTLIVAERGVIKDRNGELLAWNEIDHTGQYQFPVRAYTNRGGMGQLIGYVSYPQKDKAGFYYRTEYLGRSGIEEAFHEYLQGQNGKQLVETTALGEVISEHVVETPQAGEELMLSIDAELSEYMHSMLASTTEMLGFRSGAAAMMDVETGEIVAMASFPSYDPEILSDGDDVAAIEALNTDERFPFLNKVVGGVYTPGSIVKPFVAYGALAEKIIDPNKIIVSNGSLIVPNRYDPDNPTTFADWRAHGAMTMRDAIAYSSNVYFYTIGGGFGDQPGLGITKLHKYFTLFGLEEKTGIPLLGELVGTVPDPQWKEENFDDDWRLGDTYFTSIGQYGFLVTPIEMLRAYAALANGGKLVEPQILLGARGKQIDLNLDMGSLNIVQEGMRRTVIQDGGTARGLERKDVAVAAKSGTAELGSTKAFVNSWIAGYFPYEKPKYAFVLLMEHGPRENTLGAGRVMGWIMEWISVHKPHLFSVE